MPFFALFSYMERFEYKYSSFFISFRNNCFNQKIGVVFIAENVFCFYGCGFAVTDCAENCDGKNT